MDPKLLVRIAGDATGINRVMADVGDRATRLTSNLGGLGAAVLLPLGALTVAGAAAFTWVSKVAEGIDQLNDLSDATGATVENLSALEDVGLRTGTSLDTVGSIVVKFNNALKEADGKNGVSRALKEIGVDVEELKKLDPAEALRQVSVALAGFTDNGNKARIIQELFGKSVKDAGPFLADLAKQSELVAKVTTEEAKAAERFGHQLAELQKTALDLSRTLAGPVISEINRLSAAVKAYGGVWAAVKDGALVDPERLIGNLGNTNREIDGVTKRLARIGEIQQRDGLSDVLVRRYKEERLELEKQLGTLKARQKYILGLAPDPTGSATELARRGRGPVTLGDIGSDEKDKKPKKDSAADPLGDADRRIEQAFDRYRERDDEARDRRQKEEDREYSRRLDNAENYHAQLHDQTQQLTASLITDERARGEALIEIDRQRMAEQIAGLGVNHEEQLAMYDELNKNIVARQAVLNEQLKPEWQKLLDGWADTTQAMARFSDDFMLGFLRTGEDTFARWVETGKLDTKSLTGFIRQAFARLVYEQFLAQTAKSAGNSILQGILQVVGSLGSSGMSTNNTGTSLPTAGGRASGGAVSAGRMYEVNERGPELLNVGDKQFLMMGDKGGHVTPNGQGGKRIVQLSQTYHIGAGVSRGEVYKAVQAGNAELMARLQASRNRDGAFA